MQTALISAITAATVTMLIEYFAKPRLEIRKDGFLDAARIRRGVLAQIGSIASKLATLKIEASVQRPREYWEQTVRELYSSIEHAREGLFGAAPLVRRAQMEMVLKPLTRAQMQCFTLKLITDSGIAGGGEYEYVKPALDEIQKDMLLALNRFAVGPRRMLTYRRMLRQALAEEKLS
jgi:hypothetical protein